ncbi:MAG: hypothetical protein ACUZ8H_14780 [Candidatus Anammoxibacter sp.]
MAYFYMDTDAGSDANNGTTWALAKLTMEGLLSAMSAGDTGFIQGLSTDTAGSPRTLGSAGTSGNPIKLIGVKDGTTNTGAGVMASDLAVTLPIIEQTGGTSNFSFNGVVTASNISFKYSYDHYMGSANAVWTLVNCDLVGTRLSCRGNGKLVLINTNVIPQGSGFSFLIQSSFSNALVWRGGELDCSVSVPTQLIWNMKDPVDIVGVDMSSATGITISGQGQGYNLIRLLNCRMPSSYSLVSGAKLRDYQVELIGCSDVTSVGSTDSIQDYLSSEIEGTVDNEFTVVRTGGADDGASGGFSRSMTPYINSTLEGSSAALKSPWMPVWIKAGANTLTAYFCNSATEDSGNLFNENEVRAEFYTPDSGDTAQHEQTFNPANSHLLESSTAITADGSTWGTGGNNKQKLSATITAGFEGLAYVRLHYAKRFASSPITLYLDPKIVVT